MATVAVFLADGFEEIEALSPVDYLRRAGIEVITVGVTGTILNDNFVVTSSHKVPVIADMSLEKYLSIYKDKTPDCISFPGGLGGAQNLSNTSEILNHIEKVWKDGKIVSANCASPALVLGKTSVLKDKKWTCYPGMEAEVSTEYAKTYSNEVFITDGNLVTARGPGASEQFAMELVRILAGQETFDKIKKGSQLR